MVDIDDLIRVLQYRLKQAEDAKRLFADDPALLRKVAWSISLMPLHGEAESAPAMGNLTAWQHIQEHFYRTDNRWTTMADISARTGVPKGTISVNLHSTHPDEVEWKNDPASLGMKLWRLKQEWPPATPATPKTVP